MSARNEFSIRVILPEDAEKNDVEKALRGWAQVTSFGRTIFSRRVSSEEALEAISALNSLGAEYSLSIDGCGSGDVDPSLPVLVSSKASNQPVEYRLSPRENPRSCGKRFPVAGWCVGTAAVMLVFILVASVMTVEQGAAPAAATSIGLYEDGFTDNRYGWVVNERAAVDSGSYSLINSNSDRSVLVANERLSGHNLIAEVDVTLVGGEKERFAGLAFRIRNAENFYFLGVALDGSVAILKRELGFWSRLEPGGGIKRSRENHELKNLYHLRIVVKGMYAEFYVDRELLTIVRDQSFDRGLFGFYVDRNLDANFDNLIVTFSEYDSFDADQSARRM